MGSRTFKLWNPELGDEEANRWVREEKASASYRLMLVLSLVSSVMMAAFQLYRWTLADQVTAFVAAAFQMFIYVLFYGILTLSLLYALFSWTKGRRMRNAIPALIGVAVLLMANVLPLPAYMIDYDYRSNNKERNAAVEYLEANEWIGNGLQSTVLLPSEYRHLSKGGGEVTVRGQGEKLEILFYTFRGILDNYSGFVYTKDGSFPDSLGKEFIESKKYSSHWYWVKSA
ncbi:hypothetical protein [Cohnella sp. AR92]|uniref:hypothetical protein n=1 Tax=Cohnella sp. AR92 TaxID=648716 RepID=UPI000F8D28E2|nr:hypothetical protein [Cohnella sp. AR92]RUS45437.1 hypothetical protein ELR57_18930 [Cohnella sp. AR92]